MNDLDKRTVISPGVGGKSGTHAPTLEASQTVSVLEQKRALTMKLMEKVCDRANLNRAYKRVVGNKGAPGIDGMTVEGLRAWIENHKGELLRSLLDGSYQPQPVRAVEIPKPGGGIRQLGIPTVIDRLIQQAILQVLTPLIDPTFSEWSYGFRPGRNAHQALKKAQEHIREGNWIVVDMDVEKFFDRVNHDILMSRLARRIEDKRLLRVIRRYLEAGIMINGVCVERHEGTPQGGPLSPLLANVLLDDLDKELEKRGHKFCRYADDCNVYVKSLAAGERVMKSVTQFLWTKLKLRVNSKKSAVARNWERKFLGHRFLWDGTLGIAPQSLERAKDRIRMLTKRNRGQSLEQIVQRLNEYLIGWVAYHRHAAMNNHLVRMDVWIRRKLRCYRLKQRKRAWPIANFLIQLGVTPQHAWPLAKSSKGWWRLSKSPPIHQAMSDAWFDQFGLVNLNQRWKTLNT